MTNNKNQITKNDSEKNIQNNEDKNYYWQSTLISLILFIIFIIVLVSFGIYKQESATVGTLSFVFLVQVINIILKKFAKKYGADLLE